MSGQSPKKKPAQQRKPAESQVVSRSGKQANLPEDVQELLDVAPDLKKLPKNQILALSQTIHKVHSGPLPTPEDIKEYNDFIPNGAERIMKMAELEQEHRHRSDTFVLDVSAKEIRRGQNYGLTIGLFSIAACITLTVLGHPAVATAIFGTSLVGLVVAFVKTHGKG